MNQSRKRKSVAIHNADVKDEIAAQLREHQAATETDAAWMLAMMSSPMYDRLPNLKRAMTIVVAQSQEISASFEAAALVLEKGAPGSLEQAMAYLDTDDAVPRSALVTTLH